MLKISIKTLALAAGLAGLLAAAQPASAAQWIPGHYGPAGWIPGHWVGGAGAWVPGHYGPAGWMPGHWVGGYGPAPGPYEGPPPGPVVYGHHWVAGWYGAGGVWHRGYWAVN